MVVNAGEGKSGLETEGKGVVHRCTWLVLTRALRTQCWRTVIVWLLKTDSTVRRDVEGRSIGWVTRPAGGPYEYLVDPTAMSSSNLATFQPLKVLFMKTQGFCDMMPCLQVQSYRPSILCSVQCRSLFPYSLSRYLTGIRQLASTDRFLDNGYDDDGGAMA
jgi:hypothetical protein